ncbi:MAG: flagellar biosynthetic protein FliR [Armatimonadota bacterium]
MDEWLAQAPLLGLVFARCGGLLAVIPPLNTPGFPVPLRLGLAAALAIALMPAASVPDGLAAVPPLGYAALLVQEAALGLSAGFAGALAFWGFLIAGQLLDSLLGAGEARARAQGRGPLAGLVYLLAAAALLAADGHHWLLGALARGVQTLPIGGGWTVAGLPGLLEAAGVMLWTGVAIAAPALAAIYVAELSLAAFDRIAPGIGLADAAPAVRWTSGLLGLMVSAPLLAGVVVEQGLRAAQAIEAAFHLLAG